MRCNFLRMLAMKLLNSGGALSLEIDCCRLARPIAIFCHYLLKKCILRK